MEKQVKAHIFFKQRIKILGGQGWDVPYREVSEVVVKNPTIALYGVGFEYEDKRYFVFEWNILNIVYEGGEHS